jgi:DNA polymerase-3 subunit delta'
LCWRRVRGHDGLVDAFRRAAARGRLAHAYLFTGPGGVGKRLFAQELGKALLCERSTSDALEACDHCPSCLLVDAGSHPDLRTFARPEDKHELPIDLIRTLCHEFALKAARGRGKIVIVDDADDFTEEAANAFLKTLEEPPPRSLLLLISSNAEQHLATIRSRCQTVPFAPLPAEVVADVLRQLGQCEESAIPRLVRLAGGSPGRALELADPDLWAFRRTLLAGLARDQVDSAGLARAWTEFVEEAGKESAAQRRRAALVLRLMLAFLTDALSLGVGGAVRTTESDDMPALESLVRRVDPDTLLQLVERCLEADEHIDRRVQLVLVLESLLDALRQQLKPAVRSAQGVQAGSDRRA